MKTRFAALGMIVVSALVACGGSTKPTQEPQSAAAQQKSEPTVEAPSAATSATPSADAQAKPKEKPAAVEEEIPVSKDDPGDSGAFQLGGEHVKKVVGANQPHLSQYCWVKAMKQNPTGPKKVRLATEVEVEPQGAVKNVKVVGGDAYTGLASCVEKHMRLWRYPKAKKASSLMFPIVLEHGEVETRVKQGY